MGGKVQVFFSAIIRFRFLGVWLKASADVYQLIQLSQKGSLNVQFTQMCWLRFCSEGLFLNISRYAPCQSLLSVFLRRQCKETQLCQWLRDLGPVTQTFWASLLSSLKWGQQNSLCGGGREMEKKKTVALGCKIPCKIECALLTQALSFHSPEHTAGTLMLKSLSTWTTLSFGWFCGSTTRSQRPASIGWLSRKSLVLTWMPKQSVGHPSFRNPV